MTLDGFLTFLTLIIAVYAIMPSVARLRLRLHVAMPALISIIGFGFVIYFEYFSLFGQPCPKAFGDLCRFLRITPDSPINPGQAAFAALMTWLLLAWAAFERVNLSPHALPTLSKLVSELAYKKHYAELVELIEPHLVLLDRAATRALTWGRLHDRLWALDPQHLPIHSRIEPFFAERSVANRALALAGSKLSYLIPPQRGAENAANDIFRVLLNSSEVTTFIALSRPYFGVQLLSCSVFGITEFCDDYLTALISNSQSILYAEIQRNQNVSDRGGYEFPSHNRLLHFLFDDAKNAEKLGVWKPMGEYLLAALRPGSNPEYVQFLNGRADGFEDEKWTDKSFVVIRVFDLMVRAAENQGVQWHMWLYYFPHFLESIIAFYDATGSDIDPTDEWPTRASYLIYEMFNALTGWIEAVKFLGSISPHFKPANGDLTHENANIPKSAVLALGTCLGTLLTSECVGEHFKSYIHNIVMRTLRHLETRGGEGRLQAILMKSIIQGGTGKPAEGHGETLKRLWKATDHVVRDDLQDYRDRLWKAYP
jgi:hypothetical protein